MKPREYIVGRPAPLDESARAGVAGTPRRLAFRAAPAGDTLRGMNTSRFSPSRALAAVAVLKLVAPFAGAAPPTVDDLVRLCRADAELTSVCFLDERTGWIVGDRGVVLRTDDGGANWIAQESGVGCRLNSVCFLDPARGWIAGGYYDPYVHRSRGVVLTTTDGGATWQLASSALLPALRSLRMTSTLEGWAVGDRSEFLQSSLFLTRDGGKTWNPVPGIAAGDLAAADLDAAGRGAATDGAGRVFRIERRSIVAAPAAQFGPRRVRHLALSPSGAGVLVGDGGLVRLTADGGASWHVPPSDPAEGAGAQCDWRAVAVLGERLWIVGAPGSLVLYSPDAGRSWESFPTGQTLPLADVRFVTPERGFAVGALGTILSTADGGRTWRPQTSAPRRAAYWACFAAAEEVPAEVFVEASAAEGHLGAATIWGRRESRGEPSSASETDRRAAALLQYGLSSVEQPWKFPLPPEPLQWTAAQLADRWRTSPTDDPLVRAEAYLVRQLRTWRPDVVLTHAPAPRGDAPTNHLLHQLTLQAVASAADAAKFPEQIELLGLQPWQVKKAFGYDRSASQGSYVVKTTQVHTRLAATPADFAESGRALLWSRRVPPPAVEACRLFLNRTAHASAERDLFGGLALAAGGEARRRTLNLDAESMLRLRKAAERQRNLQAVVMQKSGTAGESLVGQLRDFTVGLDAEQTGRTLFQLAETFRAAGRWEAARETYEYLLVRVPDHAVAEAALLRLVRYFASGEADHRLRRALLETVDEPATAAAPTAVGPAAAAASALAQVNLAATGGAAAVEPAVGSAPALVGYTGDANRHRRAVALGAYLERRDPIAAGAPEFSFPLAGARRKLGQLAEAEAFYQHLLRTRSEDSWWRAAAGENALRTYAVATVKPAHRSFAAPQRPTLDGALDDDLWRNAAPLPLRGDAEGLSLLEADDGSQALVAHDAEYLYLAVRVRRTSEPPPTPTGLRERDADLTPFDRVEFRLDVDRDFATFYELTVDCRGWTNEACWDDATWNPRWFVAAGGDAAWWVVEAAVPWTELAAAPPASGEAWALSVRRTAPRAGRQSWMGPCAAVPDPDAFGYLIFD